LARPPSFPTLAAASLLPDEGATRCCLAGKILLKSTSPRGSALRTQRGQQRLEALPAPVDAAVTCPATGDSVARLEHRV
jgi:hypothetical protein